MIYKDGYTVDGNNRILECPNCHNEEFSGNASFCRICGQLLYNRCEGYRDYDGDFNFHENPGNARFCEICGRKTQYFIEGFLKPWGDVNGNSNPGVGDSPTYRRENELPEPNPASEPQSFANLDDDDGDLPF